MLTKCIIGKAAFRFLSLICLVMSLAGCAPQDKMAAIAEWKVEGRSDKIINLLYDPIQSIREEAIAALVEMDEKGAVGPLTELYTDPDLIIVHAAVDAVAAIGGPEMESSMLKAIVLDTVPARVSSATALGNFKSDAAVEALIGALDDYRYKQVVMATIESLGKVGDPRAVESLGAKLQDRSEEIRHACINALQQIGTEEAYSAISTRMGDLNDGVRNHVIEAMIERGKLSAPGALVGLRDEKNVVRANSVKVLKETEAIPTDGDDFVWFHLAELTGELEGEVKMESAEVFTGIEDQVPALLEALVHPAESIRDYASIALENVGEEAVAPTLALAEGKVKGATLSWLEGRSNWTGAPSWRIDLWAASAALNPGFKFNDVFADMLKDGGKEAEKVMTAQQFMVRREIIPYLLLQYNKSDSTELAVRKQEERTAALATKHIESVEYKAIFLMVAALNSSDPDIAIQSARQLNKVGGERVKAFVLDEYFTTFEYGPGYEEEQVIETEEVVSEGEGTEEIAADEGEEEPVEKKENYLFTRSGSPIHLAIYEFDFPELRALRDRIRPSIEIAIRDFKIKHPSVAVVSLPLPQDVEPTYDMVPVRLSYYKNEQMNDLNVVYQLRRDKTWMLETPIPNELP